MEQGEEHTHLVLALSRPASASVAEMMATQLHQQRSRQLKRLQQLQAVHASRQESERQLAQRQQREQERQRDLAQLRHEQVVSSQWRASIAEVR